MAISIPSLVKMTRSPRSFIGGKEESFLLAAKLLDLSATKTILQRYIQAPTWRRWRQILYSSSQCFWELFDRNNLGANWASEICNHAMRLRFIDFAPLCPPLWGHGSWLFSLQSSFLALKLGLQALLKGEFYIPFMFDCLW